MKKLSFFHTPFHNIWNIILDEIDGLEGSYHDSLSRNNLKT